MSEENQIYNKMLLSDCIDDITDTIIKTQTKMTNEYIENFLSDFDIIKNNDETIYVPKKIMIKNSNQETLTIPQSGLKNGNQLTLKDFNVSGKFKLTLDDEKKKFLIDFDNNEGIDLDISINIGKIDDGTEINDINNIINKLSNGESL